MVCNYWYFNDGFKFQNSVRNVYLGLMMLCFNLSNIAIITVKGADDRFVIHDIGKSEAIHLLEISVLEDCTYIKEIIIEKVRN